MNARASILVLMTACGPSEVIAGSGEASSTTTTSTPSTDASQEGTSTSSGGSMAADTTTSTGAAASEESSTAATPDAPLEPCAGYRNSIDGPAQIYRQADVAAFEGVGCITGLLNIFGEDDADPIVDLAELASLQEIGGLHLLGLDALDTLEGMNQLRVIHDDFNLGGGAKGSCVPSAVQNLDALASLESVGGLSFCGADADALVSIDGLDLALEGNVGGVIRFEHLQALTSLDAFDGVTTLSDGLHLVELPALTDISGLGDLTDAVSLRIVATGLEDLHGLESLQDVEYGVSITENPSLTTLAGLDALVHAATINISNNPMLPQQEAEELIASVDGMGSACGNLGGPPCP